MLHTPAQDHHIKGVGMVLTKLQYTTDVYMEL